MPQSKPETIHPDQLPFVAPCHALPLLASLGWLHLGWQDFLAAPALSIVYGSVLAAISYALAVASWFLGGAVLLISLLSGLVFIAPVMALGLYSVSCQIEAGQKPRLGYCLREGKRHLGNEMIFAVIMLVVFLVWTKAGTAIHIFFPMDEEAQWIDFAIFYGVGSAIGAVFAFVIFCASAFALPMMLDRRADAITAVITSVHAVLSNKGALMIWGLIIMAGLTLCFVTGFIAMPIVLPVLGYASWHGYKQTIDARQWPENIKLSDQHPSGSIAQ